ncbi:YppG family protein [Ectobacillus ponti]|uniref:YppG family protein n=1 Tax=Ectobacillus ponti TaxID=2961894 RepID=A0AA41X4J3_9BACI|nr:YppG family protein [Ectobacillus ponti]MCP8968796.1 YppG family protein [Ectobacillus ponti]
MMFPNQAGDGMHPPVMYNMHPFEPFYPTQPNYFQPFQLSFMNGHAQQPAFYPPKPPAQTMNPGFNPYTPYPAMNKQNYMKKQQSPGIMSQFKTSDGNYDIPKMMNTAGQMMNAMNQVTGLLKQVGGFFIR